ncbi:MAG: acetyl-CoA carboxylase biotin carboxyl carrier protein [Candidatus Muiribacteriaceae bacterium]
MGLKNLDIRQLEEIIRKFSRSDNHQLSFSFDRLNIVMKKETLAASVSSVSEKVSENVVRDKPENHFVIEAERVGKFFSVNPPDSPDRIVSGSEIRKGQKIANIVSMDVIYDIESPYSGVVNDIFVKDGDMVEYGQALFEMTPFGGNDV